MKPLFLLDFIKAMRYCLLELEVNNIGKFKIERMVFNNDTKEVLNKMAKRSGIKVEYYDGFIVMFGKVNVHAITPHRIVFSKNDVYLLVLYYDEYHEDDDVFYVDGERHTLLTVKRYVRNYFMNINLTLNHKK